MVASTFRLQGDSHIKSREGGGQKNIMRYFLALFLWRATPALRAPRFYRSVRLKTQLRLFCRLGYDRECFVLDWYL